MTATVELCRVSIRFGSREVDLTVATDIPIREVLPTAIDLIAGDDGEPPSEFSGRDMQLSRPGAGVLDPSKSLAQSGVRSGDLLVLTPEIPLPAQPRFDTCAAVAEAVESASSPSTVSRTSTAVASCWSAVLAGLLLGWPVFDPDIPRRVGISAVAAVLALAVALACRRRDPASRLSAAPGIAATGFAALTGWLVVPGGPGMANLLLALSAAAPVALLAPRISRSGARLFVPLAGVAGSGAGATVGSVLGWWPTAAPGPLLVTGSLAVLAAAPRLATRAARLSATDAIDDALTGRAVAAHAQLTTLVVTSAGTAALGAVLTAVSTPRTVSSAGLIAALTVTLLLRARDHTEVSRQTALVAAAAVGATALLDVATAAGPAVVPWLCGPLAIGALVPLWLPHAQSWRPSPTARRAVGVFEYATTAAVIPLGCWAVGLFAAARGLSLP